ncbi:hypothetical protein [Enterobacter roggenkampii]|uniref:hypothetical protein n=1 Tax=Enterobacter roggenkampii TaxID=1812935 RepID=UPI001FC9BE08|nr:hypothetical protein [Enterobacter roggenkampii]MCK6717643.1 hypothetical protein [Enterobacter roggenkampii]MCK7352056.1 hypothetical protein [Enterobacter roggenkampii]MCK7371170.1 hypothetical protein [Enterobacter roggenkampii]UOY43473.1 hypothetical protein LCD45_08840 [Enterobacter roggenkampii]
MSTITREFTKEQLIARAETVLSNARTAADFHNSKPYHLMDVHLAEIALASLEAEPVGEVSEQRDGLVMDGTVDLGGASTHRIIKGASKMKRLPLGTKFYTAPPAQANAEPVAWLWSHRKHPSEVSLVNPEDDERAEGAHWSGWSCQALYEAQPAPVSVPDDVSGPLAHAYKELTPTFMRNHIDIFERYGIYPDGSAGIQAMRIALDGMSRRAAMLQGAEPVTTACKLPELTDSQCLEFLAVAFRHASIKGDIEFDDIRLGLKMALEAAPQQEVKP